MEVYEEIQGGRELLEWFGFWPSFHDAEILSISLNRSGESRIEIYAFRMTDQIDADGYFVLDKDALVTFYLRDISNLKIENFGSQNVICGLDLVKEENGYRLDIDPCNGVGGWIGAKSLRIEVNAYEEQRKSTIRNVPLLRALPLSFRDSQGDDCVVDTVTP